MVRVNKVLDLLSLLILTQLSFGFPKPTVGTFKPSKVSCRLCWYLKSKSSYIKSNRWISGLIFLTVYHDNKSQFFRLNDACPDICGRRCRRRIRLCNGPYHLACAGQGRAEEFDDCPDLNNALEGRDHFTYWMSEFVYLEQARLV